MSSKARISTMPFLTALAVLLFALPAFGDSQVRIVRLSDIEGDVQIDRNTGDGFERAFLNLPVTQGVRLKTGADGFAEVEFEDGSTLRVAPRADVEFTELALLDSGVKVSTAKVLQGTTYVNFRGDQSRLTLDFGRETVTLSEPTRLRLQMNDTDSTLAVLSGDVRVEGPSGSVEVGKKQSVTFNLAEHDAYQIAKNVQDSPFDDWDKQQDKYHQKYMSKSYADYSPYAYGFGDLNYYGSFFNAPGYGSVWQPYFIGAGWDPFMNGAWMWQPGFGYTWVSAYPWGWMPYHTGNWIFIPGHGWAWQPGGSWYGWSRSPRVVNPPSRFAMPAPPATRGRGVVVVNRGPVVPSGPNTRRMVIENNSAGLGVRRGTINNMSRVSRQVSERGSVSTQVRTAPPPSSPRPQPSSGAARRPSPSVGPSSPRTGGAMPRSGGGTAPHRTSPR